MATLLRSCVEVCEPIELSFGVVSGVSLRICALDVVQVPQGEAVVLWFFVPIGFNGAFFAQKCNRLMHEKLSVFPCGQCIVGIGVSLAF